MVKGFFTVALCVCFVMAPWIAMAQQGAVSGMEEKIAAEEQQIEGELGISPDQHQKMQALRKEFQAQQKVISKELQVKKIALRNELEGDGAADRGKVAGLVVDIKALQGKMLDNRVEQVFKMREVLSVEQYKKLKEMRKKHQVAGGMRGKMQDRMLERKEKHNE